MASNLIAMASNQRSHLRLKIDLDHLGPLQSLHHFTDVQQDDTKNATVFREPCVHTEVFAWALRPSSADDAERDGRDAFAGDAFGQAHRDKSYRECHTAEGRLGMLTTWSLWLKTARRGPFRGPTKRTRKGV